MSELPKGWCTAKFGELIELKYGSALPATSRDGGEYPVFGSNGIVGHHSSWLSEGPTIIIGRKGSVGEVCFSEKNCSPIDTSYYIENNNFFNAKFLFYSIKGMNLGQLNKSTAIPGLSRKDAYELEIKLPPLAEQTRIAQALDGLLAQVDTLKARLDALPALIKRFRQSVLSAAISGSLTGSDVTKWRSLKASDVCSKVQSGGTPKKGFYESGVPFLKVYNIVNDHIDFDYKPQFASFESQKGEISKSVTYPGDVLMNIVGPPLGKIAIVPDDHPEWNINQAITLFRPSKEILSTWIAISLMGGEALKKVILETRGIAGQVNISLSQCRNFIFEVPPIEEQSKICLKVEQLFAFADQFEALLTDARARVDALTQSILAKAFRGELVPQDPADEPASALLERITAQRATAPKPKRGHKSV